MIIDLEGMEKRILDNVQIKNLSGAPHKLMEVLRRTLLYGKYGDYLQNKEKLSGFLVEEGIVLVELGNKFCMLSFIDESELDLEQVHEYEFVLDEKGWVTGFGIPSKDEDGKKNLTKQVNLPYKKETEEYSFKDLNKTEFHSRGFFEVKYDSDFLTALENG